MKSIKARARDLVYRAKSSGKLIPEPCRACGSKKSEAHHYDYEEALTVFWLCAKCHASVHKFSRIFGDKFQVCKLVEEIYWRGIPFEKVMDLVWIGATTA